MQLINEQLTSSSNFANQNVAEVRRDSWDYFLNRPRGDEVTGRSQVQSTDVRDHYHSIMSTIMPSYASDNIIAFEPDGEGDNDAADAESSALNNLFTETNDGYYELNAAISDCLLFRNGIIKVWLADEVEQTTQRYEGADPAELEAYLTQQGAEDVKVSDDGTATYSTTTQKLKIKAIEPSYFINDPNADTQDLQQHSFMAERCIKTRNELRDMGIPDSKVRILGQISDESTTQYSQTDTDIQAKFVDGQPSHLYSSNYLDQRVECFWVHMRVDGERMRFLVSGQTLLLKDSVDWWPYASGTAWPVPHRWSGLCLLDLLRSTQDSKTSIQRQFLDNLRYSNNQELAYNPAETKQEDILTRAPGRSIRSINPANVVPLPVMDIASNSLAALQHFDQVGTRQVGAALDMAAQEQGLKTMSGLSVEMQTGPAEQQVAQISRNLSETLVRDTFLLMHRTLREGFEGTISYRHTDQWTETNPAEWRPRNRINVCVGLSPGERRRHRAALERVIQYQMELIQGGTANITTTWKSVYSALNDWMVAAELDSAEAYFLNPDGQESQQGQQAAQQQSQGQQQQMQQMQQMQMQFEQLKLQQDKYEHDTELEFKYWKERMENEVEEAKLVQQGITAASGQRDTEAKSNGQSGAE